MTNENDPGAGSGMNKAKTITKPVTERSLIDRINRRLDKQGQGERLYRCAPDSRSFKELGRYYVANGNYARVTGFDLEKFARELGALKPFEQLED